MSHRDRLKELVVNLEGLEGKMAQHQEDDDEASVEMVYNVIEEVKQEIIDIVKEMF